MTDYPTANMHGQQVPIPRLQPGEQLSDVLMIARVERFHPETGGVVERYPWTATATPAALRRGMADILYDLQVSDLEDDEDDLP